DATPALLDSYEPERKPHVRAMTDNAVFFGRVITERRPALAVARNLAFRAAMRAPRVGAYFRDADWFPDPDYARGFVARASRRPPRSCSGRAGRPRPPRRTRASGCSPPRPHASTTGGSSSPSAIAPR